MKSSAFSMTHISSVTAAISLPRISSSDSRIAEVKSRFQMSTRCTTARITPHGHQPGELKRTRRSGRERQPCEQSKSHPWSIPRMAPELLPIDGGAGMMGPTHPPMAAVSSTSQTVNSIIPSIASDGSGGTPILVGGSKAMVD